MKIVRKHWFLIYVTVVFIILAMAIIYADAAELNWVFLPIVQEQSHVISVWTPEPTHLTPETTQLSLTTITPAPTMNPFPGVPTPTPVTICIPSPCVP